MCRRILGFLLAGFFTFVVATVAAFVYLEWWQAILVSGFTFLFLIAVARVLVQMAVGKVGNMAKALFDTKSRVLRGASVQVHAVRPSTPPAEVLQAGNALPPGEDDEEEARAAVDAAVAAARNLHWFEVEATIFPATPRPSPMTHWDIDDLRLVPLGAKPIAWTDNTADDDENEFGLHEILIVADGRAVSPADSKFEGPQRLRFRVGVPPGLRAAKFQYYFEQFGEVRFPAGGAS